MNNRNRLAPPREEILRLLEECGTKMGICKHYGITYPLLGRWLREREIVIPRYYGNLVKLDEEQFAEDVKTMTFGDIKRKYGLGWKPITQVCKRLGIPEPKKQGSDNAKQYDIVRERFNELVELNTNNGKNLLEISDLFGVSIHYVKSICKEKGYTVKLHSYNKSRGEIELLEWVKSLGVSANSVKLFDGVNRFEIDCFIDEMKIGIEYCGDYWHCSNREDGTDKKYHQKKFLWAKNQGIHLITIFEHEWINKQPIVKSMIRNRLGLITDKIYARKCEVKELSVEEARNFFEEYHLDGYVNSSIRLGLFYGDEIVSALGMAKPRFSKNKEDVLEITRFANKLDTVVVGGASKLLRAVNLLHDTNKLISFANLRYGQGKVYGKLGFELMGITPPSYFYIHKYTQERVSRVVAQKHKLSKILDNFDKSKTERENMFMNGFLQIYDCGNYRYEMDIKNLD